MKYKPMLATLGTTDALDRQDMIFEPKLDGYRALCYVTSKGMKFYSRNGLDMTAKYPELDFRDEIDANTCVLDGEIVVFDKKGRPDFNALQNHAADATYVVFDILAKNGRSLLKKPLYKRKEILDETVHDGHGIKKITTATDGRKLYALMKKHGLEGVIAKEEEAPYSSGKRTRAFIKVKFSDTLDAVIIGFTQQRRKVSSLALGMYKKKKMVYIGKVGTGFSEADVKELYQKLYPLIRKTPVVKDQDIPKGIIWVRPKLVSEIKYAEITPAGRLRAPVFVTLRFDKDAKECKL